jgi:hypothetical protein
MQSLMDAMRSGADVDPVKLAETELERETTRFERQAVQRAARTLVKCGLASRVDRHHICTTRDPDAGPLAYTAGDGVACPGCKGHGLTLRGRYAQYRGDVMLPRHRCAACNGSGRVPPPLEEVPWRRICQVDEEGVMRDKVTGPEQWQIDRAQEHGGRVIAGEANSWVPTTDKGYKAGQEPLPSDPSDDDSDERPEDACWPSARSRRRSR